MFRYYQNKYPDQVSTNISIPIRWHTSCMLRQMRCWFRHGLSLRSDPDLAPLWYCAHWPETGGRRHRRAYNEYRKTTGFTFAHYNADDLLYTINYAKKSFDHAG
ncbi:MAG: hypothetical protein ACLSFT_07825 [Ruminococcus callidus]